MKTKNNSGYVYRYLHKGKVVYVGQTGNELHLRIKQHCKETAFLGLTEIQYIEIPYISDSSIRRRTILSTEEYYIEKYNPIINIKKTPSSIIENHTIIVEENEWKDFPALDLLKMVKTINYCPAIKGTLWDKVWSSSLMATVIKQNKK